VNENVPVRLGFMWNMQTVRVFVDGNLVSTVSQAQKRNFINLNFSPVRRVKYLRASGGQRSSLNEILFNDTTIAEMENVVKGNMDNYFLSCFTVKDESRVKPAMMSGETAGLIKEQCKASCFESQNQVSFKFIYLTRTFSLTFRFVTLKH
jgi:hypothetical protein